MNTEEAEDVSNDTPDDPENVPVDDVQTLSKPIVIAICCAVVLAGIVIGVIVAKRKKEFARLAEIKKAEERENAEHENEGSTVQ